VPSGLGSPGPLVIPCAWVRRAQALSSRRLLGLAGNVNVGPIGSKREESERKRAARFSRLFRTTKARASRPCGDGGAPASAHASGCASGPGLPIRTREAATGLSPAAQCALSSRAAPIHESNGGGHVLATPPKRKARRKRVTPTRGRSPGRHAPPQARPPNPKSELARAHGAAARIFSSSRTPASQETRNVPSTSSVRRTVHSRRTPSSTPLS
jgi:hypothetical protein